MSDTRHIARKVLTVVAVLAAPGLLTSPAGAQPPAGGAAAHAAPAPPALALGDDIGRQADEVHEQLRVITDTMSDQSVLSALEERVFRRRQRVAARWTQTDRLLAAPPRRGPLEAMASSWRS
ncbi:MAG: hypothetical protein ABI629_16905, partial [bacterium]